MKSYLGDGVGILWHPKHKIMYIGSSNDETINYTINEIPNETIVFEIKEILKNLEPKQWKDNLSKSGFNVMNGKTYFEKVSESDSITTGEISGMGRSSDFPQSDTPGYTGDAQRDYGVDFQDPDEKKKKKLSKLKTFIEFFEKTKK